LATTLDDALAMLSATKEAGVPLYMALPVRFVPGFASMLDAVHHGQVGRVLAMVGTNHGYLPPGWFLDRAQSGGGAVMDHTPHVADLMRLIARSEVDEVYAEIDSRARNAGIDDSGILTLGFQNGIFATLDPSWSRSDGFPTWGDVTLEVVGNEGVVDFDAFRPHLNLYREDIPTHRHVGFGETWTTISSTPLSHR
jgi:predicted dehydrogenase